MKIIKGRILQFVANPFDFPIEKSVKFYTEILGFRVSDVYPDSMIHGKMVFMRCNNDHHGVALVGGVNQSSKNIEMHHMAFEVDTLDEVLRARDHLRRNGIKIYTDRGFTSMTPTWMNK